MERDFNLFSIMKYGEVKQLRARIYCLMLLRKIAGHKKCTDTTATCNTTFNSSIAVAAESKQQLKSGQYAYYAMQIDIIPVW
jgi:hypothetical protein